MYKVEIYKSIWAGKLPSEGGAAAQTKYLHTPYPEQVGFKYTTQLPFPPFIGLSIVDEQEDHVFNSEEIINISWLAKENMFACWVKDVFPHSHSGNDYDFEWLVEYHKQHGWKQIKTDATGSDSID